MKTTMGQKIFNVLNVIVISLLCVLMVYPFLNQLAISLNQSLDTSLGGITIYPRKFTLSNFETVLQNSQIRVGAFISVTRVIIGTILALLITFSAAFALSSQTLKGRTAFNWFLSLPMYISAGTIPTYILYRYLGLMNNYLVYILPGAFSFYNMLIIRSYLETLPASIEEAAKIDGANDIYIMFRVILPMSLPVVATVALWVSVGYWNDWMTTLYYVTKPQLYTLQYVMMQIIKQTEAVQQMVSGAMNNPDASRNLARPTPESVQAATLIVSTVPILVVYPFLQKYFISGVTLGAVKE